MRLKLLLFSGLLVFCAFALFSNTGDIPGYQAARQAGDTSAALNILQKYIRENINNPCELGVALKEFFHWESNIATIQNFLKELLEKCTFTNNRIVLLQNLAQIAELQGNLELAVKYYEEETRLFQESTQITKDDKALVVLWLTRLYYEQGRIEDANSILAGVFSLTTNKQIISLAYVLKGHLLLAAGNFEGAEGEYFFVLAVFKGYACEAEALLGIIALYKLMEVPEKADIYLKQLEEIAPGSPELKLAKNFLKGETSNVVFILSPQRYFLDKSLFATEEVAAEASKTASVTSEAQTDASIIPETTAETKPAATVQTGEATKAVESGVTEPEKKQTGAASAAADKPSTMAVAASEKAEIMVNYYVQVGSFSLKENADYLSRELISKGFRVSVVVFTTNGKTYYRVLIGSYETMEAAQKGLISLKESGYEGFILVQEKTVTTPVAEKEYPSGLYFIQLGSFKLRENAVYLHKELIKKGYKASIKEVSVYGTVYYKVVIGSYSSMSEAQKILETLKGGGFDGFIINP